MARFRDGDIEKVALRMVNAYRRRIDSFSSDLKSLDQLPDNGAKQHWIAHATEALRAWNDLFEEVDQWWEIRGVDIDDEVCLSQDEAYDRKQPGEKVVKITKFARKK